MSPPLVRERNREKREKEDSVGERWQSIFFNLRVPNLSIVFSPSLLAQFRAWHREVTLLVFTIFYRRNS